MGSEHKFLGAFGSCLPEKILLLKVAPLQKSSKSTNNKKRCDYDDDGDGDDDDDGEV